LRPGSPTPLEQIELKLEGEDQTDGDTDPDCWWTYTRCTTPKIASLEDDVTKCDEPNTWGLTLDDGAFRRR
jgi:hypothetical protein